MLQVDACTDPEAVKAVAARRKTTVCVSALTGEGIEDLLELISAQLTEAMVPVHVSIPYANSDLVEEVHRRGVVHQVEYTEIGTDIMAHVPSPVAARLKRVSIGATQETDDNETNDDGMYFA